MARIFVQLKLRLLLNALRSSTAAKTSFIVSSVFALILAVATFAGLAALRHNGAAVDLTAGLYTAFAFGWLILPLLLFGLDSTLDPATLALYPLRTRPLMTGLLAASVTGAWPLANLIGELGITVGLAHGALAVVIAVVATVLQVLFCIALARWVTTALAGLLRSRRGRDLAALAIIPIFGLYEIWGHSLSRALVTADASTQASAVRSGALPFATGPLSRRHSLTRAVAARVWVYQRRDPTSMIYWGITFVVMVAVSISSLRGQHSTVGALVSAAFGGATIGALRGNVIALTGPPSTWMRCPCPAGRRCVPGSPATTSSSPPSACRSSWSFRWRSLSSPDTRLTVSSPGRSASPRSGAPWPSATSARRRSPGRRSSARAPLRPGPPTGSAARTRPAGSARCSARGSSSCR